MIAAVVGCGSWGARVARRLAEIEDVCVSALFDADIERATRTAATLSAWPNGGRASAARYFQEYLEVMQPDAIVLAVPPAERIAYIDAICARERPPRLRIEKPLALDFDEAQQIARRCAAAGVQLTVGFTLLHHPLYDAAFDYLDAINEPAERLAALRTGRAPAHDVDAHLDLGIHAASIAAHLGIGRRHVDIVAMHSSTAGARTTRIIGARGSHVLVDELALEVRTPHGTISVGDTHDALGRDLRAWVDGHHRGSVEVALAAQHIVEAHRAGVQTRSATRELREVAA